MRDLGNVVEVLPPSNTGRTPDLVMNGKVYELKTVSGVQRTDSDGLSAAISSRILNGRGQSGDILIDARNQDGMTREIADRAIQRAYGSDDRQGIKSITVFTPQGVTHAPRK